MLRFHAQTAGSALTAQQPLNNVVRVALQGLAAVLGGCQSLHTNGWDEALALPSADAAQLALRTQQIIAHETGVADVVDALGGSFHIEHLTDALEQHAEALIVKIDSLGGMVGAIESGFPQQEIQAAAYQTQRALERGATTVVGVNAMVQDEPPPQGLLRVSDDVGVAARDKLRMFRAARSADAARAALSVLREAARHPRDNIVPAIAAAARARCTVGEISDALREVFGEHRERVFV